MRRHFEHSRQWLTCASISGFPFSVDVVVAVFCFSWQKPTVREKAKLGVCHPGQSYNPTEDDHEDVLASAVAVELRREEAAEDEKKPISQGMSKETLAVLVGDEVSSCVSVRRKNKFYLWRCLRRADCSRWLPCAGNMSYGEYAAGMYVPKVWGISLPTHCTRCFFGVHIRRVG